MAWRMDLFRCEGPLSWLLRGLLLLLVLCTEPAQRACAASLQVTPIMLDVAAPGAASLLTLHNTGQKPIHVQTRVFRWRQDDGQEKLEPSTDVVASPPAVELRPGQDYVVRVVRVVKTPLTGEEAYRLLIDELPDIVAGGRTIAFTVRHSIPLFFTRQNLMPPQISWRVMRSRAGLTLIATNAGDTRLRMANVKLSEGSKRTISFGSGLLGYVLGNSTMSWTLSAGRAAPALGAKFAISGQTQEGPIRAQAVVESAR